MITLRPAGERGRTDWGWLDSRAAEYGVVLAGGVSVDMKKVKARKDEVAGASNRYIGLEFAQKYRRFGSEVTVIEKRPASRTDRPLPVVLADGVLQATAYRALNLSADDAAQIARNDRAGKAHGPIAGLPR